jgi:hypothetical protein
MIIVRLLSTRAFMVGFGTTKFTRAWEPALLWNQLHSERVCCGTERGAGKMLNVIPVTGAQLQRSRI